MYTPEIRARLIPPQRAILPRKINVLRRFVQEHPGHRADLVCQATACYHSVHVGTTFHHLAIIRSFDAPSIAAPRPPGHPHLTATPTAKNPTKSAPIKSPLPTSNTPTPRHQANRPRPHRVSIFSPKKQKFLKKIARSRKQPQAIFKQFSIRTAASPPAPEEKHSPHPPDQHICTSAHKHTSDRPYFPGEIHIPRAPADSC